MKNRINSVKDVVERLIFLENKNNLLNYEYRGIKVWQLLRFETYIDIAKKLNILSEYQYLKNSFTDRFKNIFSFITSILFYNPFLSFQKKEYLIFDGVRKTKVDGEYIDIVTKYFIDDLKKCNKTYEVYEKPYYNKHLTNSEKNRKHLDFILIFSRILSFLMFSNKSNYKKKYIPKISNIISNTFSIKFDITPGLEKKISIFKAKYYLYKILFILKKPDKIFLVNSYSFAPVIKAAKDLRIKTIEFQHGMISQYHVGYHFPNSENLEYFPDELYLWSEFWKDRASYPINQKSISIIGNRYIEYQKNKYKKFDKINNNITVISQATIGKRLAQYILDNITFLSEYELFYKLHPSECQRSELYEPIKKLNKFKNFNLVTNTNIYKLFSKSQYVIGVYSTAMVESFEFGCDLIVINLPGNEYLDCLKDEKNVYFINNNKKINEVL